MESSSITDGLVNYEDLKMLVNYWLQNEPSVDIAPVGGDGDINFLDYAVFTQSWE